MDRRESVSGTSCLIREGGTRLITWTYRLLSFWEAFVVLDIESCTLLTLFDFPCSQLGEVEFVFRVFVVQMRTKGSRDSAYPVAQKAF